MQRVGVRAITILRAVAIDAFDIPGIGLDAEPCRQSYSAGFGLQFQAAEVIRARVDHAERLDGKMSRFV